MEGSGRSRRRLSHGLQRCSGRLSYISLSPRSRPIQSNGFRRRSPSSGSKEKVTKHSANRIVYMMMNISTEPPITQALYVFESSSSSSGTCQLQEVKKNPDFESPTIYPAIEFAYADFPIDMCFCMLGSNLYFFGGYFSPGDEVPVHKVYSPKVYYINSNKYPLHRIGMDSETQTLDAKLVMQEAPKMLSGKPNCYGFVANGKLYAIGTDNSPNSYTVFEFYNPTCPKKGWTSLPDPPDREAIVDAHAVVGDKVVLVTRSGVLSFDLVKHVWNYIYPYVPGYPGVVGEAILLENDTIYWDLEKGVGSFGPIVDPDNDLPSIKLSKVSGEFSDHLDAILPRNIPTSGLHHMGDNVLCYAMVGDLPHPDIPDDPILGGASDCEKSVCCIILFKIPKKADCRNLVPANEGHKKVPPAVRVLHAKRFICKSKSNADYSDMFLTGYFSAPLPC